MQTSAEAEPLAPKDKKAHQEVDLGPIETRAYSGIFLPMTQTMSLFSSDPSNFEGGTSGETMEVRMRQKPDVMSSDRSKTS